MPRLSVLLAALSLAAGCDSRPDITHLEEWEVHDCSMHELATTLQDDRMGRTPEQALAEVSIGEWPGTWFDGTTTMVAFETTVVGEPVYRWYDGADCSEGDSPSIELETSIVLTTSDGRVPGLEMDGSLRVSTAFHPSVWGRSDELVDSIDWTPAIDGYVWDPDDFARIRLSVVIARDALEIGVSGIRTTENDDGSTSMQVMFADVLAAAP